MTATASTPKVDYVSFYGPEPVQNRDGDEYPEWSVSLMSDNDDEPIKSYTVTSYDAGFALAAKIAKDRKIEFVNDADRA